MAIIEENFIDCKVLNDFDNPVKYIDQCYKNEKNLICVVDSLGKVNVAFLIDV